MGTIFIYRLCFIDFRIVLEGETEQDASALLEALGAEQWAAFDLFVTIAFWFDLVLNFLFTYDDEAGDEVLDMKLIAKHYLRNGFGINLIACIPEELVSLIIQSASGSQPTTPVNQGVRAVRLQRMRLQRISRMARLFRLGRLGKVKSQKSSHLWRWFQKQKGVRVVNLTCGLTWIVHILACGWYLCAALHDVPADTWVMRRGVGGDPPETLAERMPIDQWMHSMYFVLTVFTTVGFGDMSAATLGEIVYVCFTMAIGAVAHSIIMGEVINVVTSSDQMNVFVAKQQELIEAFAAHTELDETSEAAMKKWVEMSAKTTFTTKYDREGMSDLIMGDSMPRDLLGSLPSGLFAGKLIQNRFLKICNGVCSTPPRLPTLMALAVHRSHFVEGELIYAAQDYPFSMFLVLQGTFAFVAKVPDAHHHDTSRHRGRQRKPEPKSPAGSPRAGHSAVGAAIWRVRSQAHHVDAAPEIVVDAPRPEPLHPYMLFSAGAYFGESELVKATMPRRTSARCETDRGEVLTLNKADFKHLTDQFPQFGVKWAESAARREKYRTLKEAALTVARTYKHLAAKTIQDWFRGVLKRRVAPAPGIALSNKLLSKQGPSTGDAATVASPGDAAAQEQIDRLTKDVGDLFQRLEMIAEVVSRFAPPPRPPLRQV